MASQMFSKFWVTITLIVFLILFVILFPMMVNKYGVVGALLLSPLLVLAAILAYLRGYWVSRWMAQNRREQEDTDNESPPDNPHEQG